MESWSSTWCTEEKEMVEIKEEGCSCGGSVKDLNAYRLSRYFASQLDLEPGKAFSPIPG